MKQKFKNKLYITIGFAVFLFILTFFFFKEYVVQSSSILAILFSSSIGILVALIFSWLLKNIKLFPKIIFLLSYVIFIAVFASTKKNNSVESISINMNDIYGNWVAREYDLILKLYINDEIMRMNFYPNNKQLFFEHEIEGQVIDFFNDEDMSYFQWEILKLTSDSLIVLEKNQVLKFKKEK